ncbi:MAG: putative Zn-dependent protease, involved in pqq synthesis (ppqF) [Nitrospirae bacterium]|nr:putative Zn-dependent protease, involved in pqq synthesis (ppqF) [Nitrospirota bacterium]
MKILRMLFILLALLFHVHAYALDVAEYTLKNGLKVLILEDHKAPTATFQIWYRVGSRDENIGKTGLSHLLEHMMFKGTEKHGPKTFSRAIQRAGGTDNAFTSKEYTGYFELLASDRIGLPIELEADRMRNLILAKDAVLSERDVVMEERRLRYEDDPQSMVYEEVIATAFQNHSYRWPVIGWMSDLKDLKPGDLMNHYQTYYAPNNAVIIVVGDVQKGDIVSKITAAFGDIPEGPEIQRPKIEEGPQRGEKRLFVKKEAELPFIVSAYKVPDIKHEDGFALDVLGSILSDGKSSRLYQKLVYQQQIALSAWAGYEGLYKDPFLFLTGATAASGKNIEEVEKAINDEIEKIKKAPPSEIEVQKAKNQIEASFIMGQDSIYMQAKMIGTFEMIGGWRLWERYLEGIRRVSPEDVRHVAEKYLVSDARTTGILMPLKADRK